MKIALIHPHYREGIPGKFPSLGLGYIAATLEDNGCEVDYIDVDALNLTNDDLKLHLFKHTFDVVGITCNSTTFREAKKTAKIVRESIPDTFIVIGGPHLNIYPKETVQNPEFDAGIYGEGEYTMLELVKTFESRGNLHDIRGLIHKEDGKIIVNPPRRLIRDLDVLPFPARHLMPNDEYNNSITKKYPFTTLITSRGCPFKCFYCQPVHGEMFRARSPDNVVDEIEDCINKFGIQEIQIYDDTFTLKPKRVNAICDEIINRRLNIILDCRTRIDLVTKALLTKMKSAGCERIRYGIESGDQQMLNIMKKGVTLDQVATVFEWTREAGIETYAYFMIGSPGETLEKIQKTIDFAEKLKSNNTRFSITTAYPGTEMYNAALNKGYFTRDVWRDYTLGLIDAPPNPMFETEEYTQKDLEAIIKKNLEVS